MQNGRTATFPPISQLVLFSPLVCYSGTPFSSGGKQKDREK